MAEVSVLSNKTTLWARIWKHRILYLLLLPALAWYFLFRYWPMYGIIIAFKKFMYNRGILGSPWVGLANFAKAFNTMAFWYAFRNTVIISAGNLAFVFPVPILLALLLNETRWDLYKRTVQTVLYLPHFISWVILAGILFNILSVNGGLINKLRIFFGADAISFLTRPNLFRPIVFLSNIWKESGWSAIIYMATLAGINPELYEAAVVDGASRWRRFLHITWPELVSTIVILLILHAGQVMNAGFDQIFNLQNPTVWSTGDIIDTYVYRETLLKGDFSYGTAVGLFQSVIDCVLLFTVNWTANRIQGSGLY